MTSHEAKIAVFMQEFPWLKDFMDPSLVLEAKVSRITQEVLDYRPIHEKGNADEPRAEHTHMYLVNSHGISMAHVGYDTPEPDLTCRWKRRLFSKKPVITATASQALAKLGVLSGDIQFIVCLSPDAQFNYGSRRHLTIYKSPRGFTLNSWKEQLLQRAKNLLNQQIADLENYA